MVEETETVSLPSKGSAFVVGQGTANRDKQTDGRVCIPVLKPQQLPAIRTEGGGLGSPPSLLEGLCTLGKWAPLRGLSDLTKHICDSVKGEIEEGGGVGGRQ